MNNLGFEFVQNEDQLKAAVNMKFKVDGGEKVKLLSNLVTLKSHYVQATQYKAGATIAYMGEDSEAVKRGLKTKRDYFYLVEMDHMVEGKQVVETVVLLVPAKVVYDINEYIDSANATAAKNGKKDKRQFSWKLEKHLPKTKDEYPSYSAVALEQIDAPSKADIEANNEILSNTLTGYVERLREKYHEYMGSSVDEVPPQQTEDKTDDINLDDIPF
jgi:hypothetical protein